MSTLREAVHIKCLSIALRYRIQSKEIRQTSNYTEREVLQFKLKEFSILCRLTYGFGT